MPGVVGSGMVGSCVTGVSASSAVSSWPLLKFARFARCRTDENRFSRARFRLGLVDEKLSRQLGHLCNENMNYFSRGSFHKFQTPLFFSNPTLDPLSLVSIYTAYLLYIYM